MRPSCILLAFWLLAVSPPSPAQEEPVEVGQLERAGRRLVQLDLTVRGPADRITDLGADDFDLKIEGTPIEGLVVDRVCETGDESLAIPTTYIFYFDQPFLSLRGRATALDFSRELIPQIVKDGSRAIVVSNGRRLTTFASLTSDVSELLAAIDRIEADPEQWDPVAVVSATRQPDEPDMASMLPTTVDQVTAERKGGREVLYSGKEFPRKGDSKHTDLDWYADLGEWRSRASWMRASMMLGRMINLDLPKVMIYFADRRGSSALARDRFVTDANAQGVRIYPIGSGTPFEPTERTADRSALRAYMRRLTANHDGLATQTGGKVFHSDRKAWAVGRKLLDDMACFYLLSFDAEGLPRNRDLEVDLAVRRKKVQTRTRSSIRIRSDSARVTAQLLGAFAAPELVESSIDVQATLIPVGFANGKYTHLVQVAVAGSPLPNATWELGASLISGGEVRQDVSGKISVDTPHAPIVLESEMTFAPGNYELVMVARETNQQQKSYSLIGTGQIAGELSDPRRGPPSVGPVAIVQPEQAIFVRGDDTRRKGSLGRSGAVVPGDPTLLVALICHGSSKATLEVTRRLIGATAADFPKMAMEPGQEPCIQIRDAIPAGTLTEGRFRYEISVHDGGETVASGVREFTAVIRKATP